MKVDNVKNKMVYLENSLTKRVLFNEEKVLTFILNMMPGQVLPPHQHEESDLVMHVIAGSGELTVDSETRTINTGDVIYCTGSEVFSMNNNTSENLSCFVVIAPRPTPKIYSQEFGSK